MNQISDVNIDDSGRFKYILIRVSKNGEEKHVVRGYKWAEYHADIFDDFELKEARNAGVQYECVGGGRILHEPAKKEILVYGYSQGFGRANHEISVDLLKVRYPDYSSITFSNDGYWSISFN